MRPPLALKRLPAALVKAQQVRSASAAAALAPQYLEADGPVSPPSAAHVNTTASSQQKCHTCGKPMKPVHTVNANSRFLHCSDCNSIYATSSGAEANNWKGSMGADMAPRRPPYPSEIAGFLDKYVVGQLDAKKTLAVGIYQHYRRLANNLEYKQKTSSQNFLNGAPNSGVLQSHPVATGHMEHTIESTYGRVSATPQSPQQPQQQSQAQVVFRSIPNVDTSLRLDKSNVLLLGPSGVGKTYVTQVLARILEVPIALCDCTSMTQAGYVGEDVENCCAKLLQNAQGNVERAQQGIVFLDEIDKIAAAGDSHSHAYRDVSGEGVQNALLKLVEGTVVNVKSGRKGPGQQDTVQMDTTDILFVGSGAFGGLEKIVGQRLDKRGVGFGAASFMHSVTNDDKEQSIINEKRDKLFSQADQGDLIKFGIVPELVGRFPVLVPFHSFNREMLVRVLSEPANSLLAQMKYQFAIDGVDLDFDADALEEIAQLALERKTGARALRSIVEKVLLMPKFEVPGSDIERVTVTKKSVQSREPCRYERRANDTAEGEQQPTAVAVGGNA